MIRFGFRKENKSWQKIIYYHSLPINTEMSPPLFKNFIINQIV